MTRSWGEESDFIKKVSKLRRWRTNILKNHLQKIQKSEFFYVREKRKQEGFEVDFD